ncbi:2-phospho-L-lactate guanylyltransferase [Gammaproteobacteria bacterium]|nr:2-phospho-L-lactate guanylyltransferase [Gammaproteobacteria bacterium]
MNVSAFIPIKKFTTSKKRLSKVISSSEREALAASMANNTIDILSKSNICHSITVVTNDSSLSFHNTNSYFTESSLNEGLEEAINSSAVSDHILIMHADLPRINETDLQHLLSLYDRAKVSIVSDIKKQGTNCLMFSGSLNFQYKFGTDSYNLFLNEFKNNGINFQDIDLPSLQDDLDSEEDYFKLIKYIKS